MTENQEQRPIPERNRDIQRRQESMWILNNEDYREFQAYKATGLSPNDLQQIKAGLLPDSEDRAPMPSLKPIEPIVAMWHRKPTEEEWERRIEYARDAEDDRDSCWLLEDEL